MGCKVIALAMLYGLAVSAIASAQAQPPNAPDAPVSKPDAAPPASTPAKGADTSKATPPPAGVKTSAPPKSAGTAATVVDLNAIESVMGKSVRSRSGNEDMGRIVDVLVNGAGQVRAAVIDFGGFLGVGSRKVAVAWKTLDFSDSIPSGSVKVTLTRDQVRQSPEFKPGEPVVILEGSAPPKSANETPPSGHNQDAPQR